MPPKSKKKSTRKKINNATLESQSSSEECEYTDTLDIITKLSQKYLNTGKKTSKKKNGNSCNVPEIGYDGDEENTTASSASSSVGSPYDFEDEPMSEGSSSSQKETKKKRGRKSNKKQPKQTSKKTPQIVQEQKTNVKVAKEKSPTLQNKSVRFKDNSDIAEKLQFPKTPVPKVPVVALGKLDVQMVEESQRQLRKRKSQNTETVTPNIKVTKKETVNKVVSNKQCKNISVIQGKIVPEMVQDMSTPIEMIRTRALTKSQNDSCFGFEKMKRTSLAVSPVCKLPITPLSDYASMDTLSLDVTMEDSTQKSNPRSPTLFSMDEEDAIQVNKSFQKIYKPKKKINTKKQQIAKSNEWAQKIEKMSVEFQEIESFELSIEQD